MTGAELKQMREDLGHAIGRRLSTADMARICGLAPKNGADTWRKWEEGEGPSGPVATLISILACASNRYPIPGHPDADKYPDGDLFREMIQDMVKHLIS